ncbi:MAG TPA: WYL domain-containing protein, partial [Armatimonadota bacterium]|nr:WYL domain-containing protein [Armatimonadota bacterium]
MLKAIEQRRQVRMTYYTMSRDEETERTIDPYHLYHYDGLWYVYGHCHARHENRDFAINRIRLLTLLPTIFSPPSQEDIRRQLGLRFANITDEPVTVSIWFDKDAARRIRERIWHPSQQIAVQDDGSCILTMTVTGYDTV